MTASGAALRLRLTDHRGGDLRSPSVVAASTETTPWSSSRLITTWPPKTGTPSTTWSARTTEPRWRSRGSASRPRGTCRRRCRRPRRSGRAGPAPCAAGLSRRVAVDHRLAVGRADEVDDTVGGAVDPQPARPRRRAAGRGPSSASAARSARTPVAGRASTAVRPRLRPPAVRSARARGAREQGPASIHVLSRSRRARSLGTRKWHIRQTGEPVPTPTSPVRSGSGEQVRDLLYAEPAEVARASPASDGSMSRCRHGPPRRAASAIAESTLTAVDSRSSMTVVDLGDQDDPAGRVLARSSSTGATSSAAAIRAAYSHSSSSASGQDSRSHSVTACACTGDGPMPPSSANRARASGSPARRRGRSSRSAWSCGFSGLRLRPRGARSRVSLALSTSSSSASRTHWPSTSMSGSASRSALMP